MKHSAYIVWTIQVHELVTRSDLLVCMTAPAPVLIRVPTQDASLVGPGLTPSGDSVVVPKGTEIILDLIGAGYNARNFPDPERFNPQRWASEHVLDSFLSFSVGPRGCLGRKFSTVEAVCFLTHLLRDWEFDVKLEGKETLLDWRERVMQPRIETTLRVGKIFCEFFQHERH